MASACAQSVFGFGADLDRRPTIFVPALASESLCSLCGLLPATSFMLPCMHLLCGSCFYQYRQISDHCPLDKRVFRQEEVAPMLINKEAILGCRIRCWNAGNGCGAEDAVSVMLDHFANACMFHTVNCQKCGEKILHRELPGHVMSGCAATCSPARYDKGTLAASFPYTSEMLEKTSQENASTQTGLASIVLRIHEMKKMMDHLSATICHMTAEAGRIKGTTWGPQIVAWISEIEDFILDDNAYIQRLDLCARGCFVD
ncbi:TNF receptor-associated factor 3-like [Rhipicephalus sanguineus]|uniref:TNF receptor-associated factor 3-like n=1 Tax=Rhipicephalus sanguineus TaxID=34632 RepID=UPI0020C32458|nr:TNF receptor-associated factor 3-like [Rhipicephalus sanguineus]